VYRAVWNLWVMNDPNRAGDVLILESSRCEPSSQPGAGGVTAPVYNWGVGPDLSTEPPRCPRCGAPGIPILYGMPGPELIEASERGDAAIGGCVIDARNPTHQCSRCETSWIEESADNAGG